MPTAAQIIARRLYDQGCRYAFGMPGGEVLTMLDALREVGIEFVLVKHENAGGYMAEGIYHMTGAPAILLATVGPGVANAVNTVANAEQDRVPLIFLTGCVDAAEALTYNHQIFDHVALMKPVTKGSFTVADGNVDVLVDKALAIALDGQPGPVHIDLPIAIAKKQYDVTTPVRRPFPSLVAPAPGGDIEQAKDWLRQAKKPLIIAGLDVLHQHAEDAVTAFARDFGIPVITTYKAKGVLDENDPLAMGGAGLSPVADEQFMKLVKNSDFILLAGYDPIEMRSGWIQPWSNGQRVVEFSAVPNHHYVHTASMSFVGDIGAGLTMLRDGAAPVASWPDGEPAKVRKALIDGYRLDEAWGPAAIVDVVRSVMEPDGVATVDSGAHRILLSQAWKAPMPRRLLQSTGLCTMGIALPLAIGAKLAAPSRQVVSFSGDAGIEMVLNELATARDKKTAIVAVVFVDESLSLIELKQRNTQLPNVGVDFGATDFPAVARALGGEGMFIEDRETLERELKAAFARDCFTVLACRIDRRAYDGRL
ncbi:thiamine pyrophosphate-binding protein [Alphaproteobacteria bacterium HT1-32]|nr:thiamine pyrophosphate-binding protein [Alphaproteobacteria bacterium HT1-32]